MSFRRRRFCVRSRRKVWMRRRKLPVWSRSNWNRQKWHGFWSSQDRPETRFDFKCLWHFLWSSHDGIVLRHEPGHGVGEHVPQLHPGSMGSVSSDRERSGDTRSAPTTTELEVNLSCLGTVLVSRPCRSYASLWITQCDSPS